MGFDKIIYFFVLFLVGFVWFNVVSLLRLPHLRVFVYAIEPKGTVMMVWRKVQAILLLMFAVIVLFFLFMYVLWLIIKKFIPNFPIPLRTILLKIPPFPQLERAGIFAFFHNIMKAIFGKGKFAKRAKLVGKACADFIARNTNMMLRAIGLGTIANRLDKIGAEPKDGKYVPGKAKLEASKEEQMAKNRKKRRDPPFEAGAYRKADDELQQCLEENTVHVTNDMSKSERERVAQRNAINRIICKARGVQSWARTLTGRS